MRMLSAIQLTTLSSDVLTKENCQQKNGQCPAQGHMGNCSWPRPCAVGLHLQIILDTGLRQLLMRMCRTVLHYEWGSQQAATNSWHCTADLEKLGPFLMQVHARQFCSQDAESECFMHLQATNSPFYPWCSGRKDPQRLWWRAANFCHTFATCKHKENGLLC